MGPFPIFLRSRMVTFTIIMLISLIWTVLLCIEVFVNWDVSDSAQKSLIIVLMVSNSSSAVLLPALLAVGFKALSEAVPIFTLFVLHIGAAVLYTISFSQFSCPLERTNDPCRTINLVILAGSWVNPVLLILYSTCLVAILVWRWRDPEAFYQSEKRQSELPMMVPPAEQQRSSGSVLASFRVASQSDGVDGRLRLLWLASTTQPAPQNSEETDSDTFTPRSSGRLSKPLPNHFF